MACNLDSRLEQLEEQGKTMVDATRRLLETVNAVKDTAELLLQMIENHQKMLEMSRRVENLINDAKMEVKVESISDEEEDWGDNSSPTPHPSEDWDAEADHPPFYIPVRRTITVEQWAVPCLWWQTKQMPLLLNFCLCGNITTKPALFRATHFFKKE